MDSFKYRVAQFEKLKEKKENEWLLLINQNNSLLEHNRHLIETNAFLENENKHLKIDLDEIIGGKQQLQANQLKSVDYNIQMEEKVYKSNKISLELLKQLKDAEVEIETLK